MLSQCTNPGCGKPLTHLHNGRVIRTVQYKNNVTKIQHFWLCGECCLICDFIVSAGGIVSCVQREVTLAMSKEHYFGHGSVPSFGNEQPSLAWL
jgi:hypothetical protein